MISPNPHIKLEEKSKKPKKKLIRKSIDQLNLLRLYGFLDYFYDAAQTTTLAKWCFSQQQWRCLLCWHDKLQIRRAIECWLTPCPPSCRSDSTVMSAAVTLEVVSHYSELPLPWLLNQNQIEWGAFFSVEMEIPQWWTDRQFPSMVNL